MNTWTKAGRLTSSLALVAVGLVMGMVVASTGAATSVEGEQQARPASAVSTVPNTLPGMLPQGVFVNVADELRRAVVFIQADHQRSASAGDAQSLFDFFRRRRDQDPDAEQEAPEQTQRSQGSGVVVSEDGYVLTNAHVVTVFNLRDGERSDARRVTITLVDETEYEAEIIGVDLGTDIALLKIDARQPLVYRPPGRFRQVARGRVGHGGRRALRPAEHSLRRNRLGDGPCGPQRYDDDDLPGFRANRRRHQPGQLGRSARQPAG